MTYTFATPTATPHPAAHLPLLTPADVPDTVLMQTLYKALSMRRAGGSATEAQFVAWLANRLPVTMIDEAGNIHVDRRTAPEHRTMFTSHTDTVHHEGGANAIRLDTTGNTVWRADAGACLGADDGAGVALMMHMLDAGVPGYFVFFRQEESGGVGSQWLADNYTAIMGDGIDRCVSLDRAGYADVITAQGGSRCCSDDFAFALADALTTEDLTLAYSPSDRGVFTDSANLTDCIPECTNVSISYKAQHGDHEMQDVTFLQALAAQLCLVPWDTLPTKRDPSARLPKADRLWDKWLPKAPEVASLDDALFDASNGSTWDLHEIVATHLLPDNPGLAYTHIKPSLLTTEDYAYYVEQIDTRAMTDYEVLDELVEHLYTE